MPCASDKFIIAEVSGHTGEHANVIPREYKN